MSRRKLTPKDELRIVEMRDDGHTLAEITARFGCSRGTVWSVLQGRSVISDAASQIAALTKKTARHAKTGCTSGSVSTADVTSADVRLRDEDDAP